MVFRLLLPNCVRVRSFESHLQISSYWPRRDRYFYDIGTNCAAVFEWKLRFMRLFHVAYQPAIWICAITWPGCDNPWNQLLIWPCLESFSAATSVIRGFSHVPVSTNICCFLCLFKDQAFLCIYNMQYKCINVVSGSPQACASSKYKIIFWSPRKTRQKRLSQDQDLQRHTSCQALKPTPFEHLMNCFYRNPHSQWWTRKGERWKKTGSPLTPISRAFANTRMQSSFNVLPGNCWDSGCQNLCHTPWLMLLWSATSTHRKKKKKLKC